MRHQPEFVFYHFAYIPTLAEEIIMDEVTQIIE